MSTQAREVIIQYLAILGPFASPLRAIQVPAREVGFQSPVVDAENGKSNAVATLVVLVLSEPATLKQECSTYDFDPSGGAASRLNSRTGTMPFGSHAFVPQSAPLSPDGYQYRNTSLPAYPYTIRPFYAMPSYGDFGEEGVDYGLQVPLMGTEHLALTPNYITSSAAGRGWTPQMPRTPLYVEQSETPYNHNQLPFHGYPPRLNSNSEIKHGSLNGIGGSLPPPSLINGNVDRMLPPVPSSNNRTAQIGPYLRSNDGLPATTTLQTQPYPDFGMIRNSKHHNNNTISDNSSMASVSYMPMSSTSPESLSSSQMAYGSQTSMSMSQHSDIYTPPSTDGLCTNESSGAPSYGHISGASKGGSQSSHASSGDGSLPPLQNGSGPVNDREYHYAPAPNSSSYHYPMPPIHQPTPVSGRPSISVGGDQE
ncbi:uncharacterized protein RCO7_01058 [Rhynchosporium graminicola]|uniref:Uncharacterized protein n=1 Tax=Rhynchosporium graminicola TaxID=2792576 RepID=A0A1E1JQS3_9HELO|nr:uncharacterized protein RCO7_01058 [Rhynchosporium commune]